MNQSASYARKAHILTLLKSGRPVSVSDIVESLGKVKLPDGTNLQCVTKTVIRDIAGLKAMGCPVTWRRSLDSYELADLSWDMPATPLLGRDEILAVAVGNQFGAAALPKKVGKSVHSVAENILKANSDQFYHGADISTLRILIPPVAPETEKKLAIVYDAWATHHLLTITYCDGTGKRTERTIEPHMLFFYGSGWYVGAFCYSRRRALTFAVSRIEKATVEDGTFAPNPKLFEDASFDNFGIFDEDRFYNDIIIRLTAEGRRLAVANVLHSKQEIAANGDGTFTLTVPKKAKHLAVQWVLAQRGEAVPVAPAELVDDVIAASKAVLDAALAQKENCQ